MHVVDYFSYASALPLIIEHEKDNAYQLWSEEKSSMGPNSFHISYKMG